MQKIVKSWNPRLNGSKARVWLVKVKMVLKEDEVKNKTNMYKLSVEQWNPFVGCYHDCKYGMSSFKAQIKRWAKKNYTRCYKFVSHEHEEGLEQKLPRTGYMQFIFTCSSGDVSFCPTEYMMKLINRIRSEPEKTFLIQSKGPASFNRVTFPRNVILGATLETNKDDLYEGISKAPKPSQRYRDFLEVKHPLKMVTIEPIIDFDLNMIVSWMVNINPCMVWLGYDSRSNHLPEPELEKVKSLCWELGRRGFVVILKKIRKAWWEK